MPAYLWGRQARESGPQDPECEQAAEANGDLLPPAIELSKQVVGAIGIALFLIVQRHGVVRAVLECSGWCRGRSNGVVG